MNELKITITNDGKGKENSYEATAIFDYVWNNSWDGYGGDLRLTAFGSNEAEAREKLIDELFLFQLEFVKALTKSL